MVKTKTGAQNGSFFLRYLILHLLLYLVSLEGTFTSKQKHQPHHFTVLEAGRSKIKVLADSVCGEGLLPGS